MDPITALGAAASVIAVIQMTQSVASSLKELYRDIRQARTEIERLYDSIISLETIAKRLDDVIERRAFDTTSLSLLEDSHGPLKQALLEVKHLKETLDVAVVDGSRFEKAKLSFKHSAKQSLGWHFKKDEVLAMVERLNNHRLSLTMNSTVDILSIQFEQSDILGDIRQDIAAAQNNANRRRVIDWLAGSVADPSIEHNNALKKHEETTGSWLIESVELEKWMSSPNSVLWLNGNAGAGKSILISTIIDHVQQRFRNELNIAVVYWYFTFRDTSTQKVEHCLRSLVTNLCSKRREMPTAVQEEYEKANNGQLSPSTAALMKMLESCMDGFDEVYLFFDALDECPQSGKEQERERDELLKRINDIRGWEKTCLHVFTASRREADIEEFFTSALQENLTTINVQGAHVQADISKYIQRKLADRKFRNWKPELKEEVETRLSTQADGMFRLVALQLDVLLKSASVAMIQKALDTLPVTLDLFYDRILRDIPSHAQRVVSLALQWLAYAARPLSLSELAEAVVIGVNDDFHFNPVERFMDENELVGLLPAGLVRKVLRVQPETDGRWIPETEEVPFIEFAHFSVLEYLRSDRIHPDLPATYRVQEQETHRIIAASCFSYLLYIGEYEQDLATQMSRFLAQSEVDFEYTEDGWDKDSKYWKRWNTLCGRVDASYYMAAYASRAWHHHVSHIDLQNDELLRKLAVEFMEITSKSWTIWCCFSAIELYNEMTKDYCMLQYKPRLPYQDMLLRIHPIQWVAYLGLSDLLALLLNDSPPLAAPEQTQNWGSPLHAASLGGDVATVRALLAAQADVNERGGYWELPLLAAIANNFVDIVELLLDAGADANPLLGPRMETALIAACSLPDALRMVKLLVKAGAEVNFEAKVSPCATALISACHRGDVGVVKFLMESGADVDFVTKSGIRTGLVAACHVGSVEVVEMLLDAGAQIGNNHDIMRAAISSLDINTVNLLVDWGAHIGSKEGPDSAYSYAMDGYQYYEDEYPGKAGKYKGILDFFDGRLARQEQQDEHD